LQSELNAAQQQIEKIKKSNETRIKEIEQEHQDSLKRTLEEALEQIFFLSAVEKQARRKPAQSC